MNSLINLCTTEIRKRCQATQYFLDIIEKMCLASQVVIKAFEDEQNSHNETKKNYEQTTEKLKAKDCLIVSLQESIATGEAKVLAAEQLATLYKQRLIEEQEARQETRRSYQEKVNSPKEPSESDQTSDLGPEQVEENFQRGLEKAKSSELEPRDLNISNLQSQNKALCVQIQHSTSDIRKRVEETQKSVVRDLQELNTLCLGLEENYQSGIASCKQQVEFLEQELEKEKASHADTRETMQNIILTNKAQNEELCSQMQQQTSDIYKLIDETKSHFKRELEQKDVLYKNVQQELERERQAHLDTFQERQNIILTIMAEKEALCLQMLRDVDKMERLWREQKLSFLKHLEEKDVLYQSRDDKYKAELSDVKQQMENVQRELEEEIQIRKEMEEIICTILAESEGLSSQMQQQTSDLNNKEPF
ncbi:protein CROWDED NUCLEI 2-like [Nothobranchius furzeri]|uniref:Protein CROWDED NUCLEI 2-like n=1 Tax=Nothobranchius furzeri TaxID=105023 RepID=A0A9D2XY33_NOTFU|nr:protein CROWDED NUCLEI 2-like [Nothobranchius furzeri]